MFKPKSDTLTVFFWQSATSKELQPSNSTQSNTLPEPPSLAPPMSQQQPPSTSPLPQQLQNFNKPVQGVLALPPSQPPIFPPGVKVDQQGQSISAPGMPLPPQRIASASPSVQQQAFGAPRGTPSAFPGSLSDLVVSFENVKQKGSPFYFYWIGLGTYLTFVFQHRIA